MEVPLLQDPAVCFCGVFSGPFSIKPRHSVQNRGLKTSECLRVCSFTEVTRDPETSAALAVKFVICL